jgi:hypothetical protein
VFILTTPNVFYFKQALFLMVRGYPAVNAEHTCWFDEVTLRQLIERFGFFVDKVIYLDEYYPYITGNKKIKIILRLKALPFRIIRNLVQSEKLKSDTIMIFARLQPEK